MRIKLRPCAFPQRDGAGQVRETVDSPSSLMCINFSCAFVGYSHEMGARTSRARRLGRATMFRNILVHISSERPVRPVIDVAVALTLGRRAHLDAIAIGYESTGPVGMIAEGGGAAVAAAIGYEQERALERANAAISVFEVEAKRRRIVDGMRALAAAAAEAEETIGILSRFYDLTVLSQPDSSFST